MDIVKDAWRLDYIGSPSYIWESKLRKVCYELKAWMKTEYKSASNMKSQLQSGVADLHSKMEKEEITSLIIS